MSEGGCKIGKDFIGKIGYGSLEWASGKQNYALSGFGSWEAHEDMDDIKE